MKLFWLEVKQLVRKPACLLFLGAFALIFYFGGVPSISPSLDTIGSEMYGELRQVVSIAEWARLGLLYCGSLGLSLFAALVFVLSIGVFWPEFALREVLWSAPGGSRWSTMAAKLLAVSTLAVLIVLVSSAAALLNPSSWESWSFGGYPYVPLYIGLLWLQGWVWATFAAFLLFATASRWISFIIFMAVAVVLPMVGLLFSKSSSLTLLYKILISWNFLGPYAPLGLVPWMLAWQTLILFAVVLLLFAGGRWARRRFWEWQEAWPLATSGLLGLASVVLLGAAAGLALGFSRWKAPIKAVDLYAISFEPFPERLLARPYIWTKDGTLIFHPGSFALVRLPLRAPMFMWVQELAQSKTVRRYEVAHYSLVLLYPPDQLYPSELEGIVKKFVHKVEPLLKRAVVWQEEPQIVVLPPGAHVKLKLVPQGFLVSSETILGPWPTNILLEQCAWALTDIPGLSDAERVYLALYLLQGVDGEKVAACLDELHRISTQSQRCSPPWLCPHLPHFLWRTEWTSQEAAHILQLWQKGEEIGHEAHIRELLGRANDQS